MCEQLAHVCHGASSFIEDSGKRLNAVVLNALVRATELSLEQAKFTWLGPKGDMIVETGLTSCFRNELQLSHFRFDSIEQFKTASVTFTAKNDCLKDSKMIEHRFTEKDFIQKKEGYGFFKLVASENIRKLTSYDPFLKVSIMDRLTLQ
jgi:hypothetical protein